MSEFRAAYGSAREFATGQMSPPHFSPEDLEALATLIKFRDAESPGETFAKWLERRFGEWIASIDHDHPARLTVGYAPRFFTRFLDMSKPEIVAVKPKRDASYDPTKDPHSIRYIPPPCPAPLPAVMRAQAAAKREAERAAAALAAAPPGEVGT